MLILAGSKMCRRPHHLDHDLRRHPQPPAAARRHGDGVHHVSRRQHASLRLHAERRRDDESQFSGKNHSSLFIKHGHDLSFSSFPHGDTRPHAITQRIAIPTTSAAVPSPVPRRKRLSSSCFRTSPL